MYSIVAPAQMHMGPDSLSALKGIIAGTSDGKILLVTDEGIRNSGILERVLQAAQADPARLDIFDRVEPNPDIPLMETCGRMVAEGAYSLILGVGGGSPMDVAKAASVLPANGGKMRPILGRGMLKKSGLPLCLIPTTSGSGSEVTQAVVVADPERKTKVSIWDARVVPESAIIDPVLSAGMPPRLTADTGLDAVVHAIEAYTVRTTNPVARLYAQEAIKLAAKHLPRAVEDGKNMEARAGMSLSATLAGIGFSNSGLGAVHGLSLPLESKKHIAHGRSVAIMAPWIMDFNGIGNEDAFAAVAGFLGEDISRSDARPAGQRASSGLKRLMESIGVSPYLKDHGVEKGEVEDLAREAFRAGQRLMPFNPREMTERDVIDIYHAAFGHCEEPPKGGTKQSRS
jgi:alcohol dehydrogenase